MDGLIGGILEIVRFKYNSIFSILRLGIDGNLRVYIYLDKVDWGVWEVIFILFVWDSIYVMWDIEC